VGVGEVEDVVVGVGELVLGASDVVEVGARVGEEVV
jgi:hypothetical protein